MPEKKVCGVQIWFTIHRPIMISSLIFSLISFLVILSELDWKWVTTSQPATFAHSIFGIVSIGFAFFQVITCKFFLYFNWFHKSCIFKRSSLRFVVQLQTTKEDLSLTGSIEAPECQHFYLQVCTSLTSK